MLPYSDDGPRDPGVPWMTWALIAVNSYIWFKLGMREDYEFLVEKWGFTPANPTLRTAFTSMFLHGDLMHLLGNMWFLFVFGDNVELRVGPIKYLFLYLLAGLCGDASHYFFFSHSAVPSIGASGAIFGVMGMYLYLFPYNRVKFVYFIVVFIGTFELSALWAIGFFFLKEALFGYVSTRAHVEGGVGHLAHAGGFLGGLLSMQFLSGMGLVRDDGRNLIAWMGGGGSRSRNEEEADDWR